MHDTLHYMSLDPIYRAYHHDAMTFGLVYAFSERFVLPLSHDEVVHGKRSLIGSMPGDRWQRFANLRAYSASCGHIPARSCCSWGRARRRKASGTTMRSSTGGRSPIPCIAGMQRLVGDLNGCYRREPALHALDTEAAGFRWMSARTAPTACTRSIAPAPRQAAGDRGLQFHARAAPPLSGRRAARAGAGARSSIPTRGFTADRMSVTAGGVQTSHQRSHGQPFSLEITVPPLATLYLRHDGVETASGAEPS